MYFFSMEISSKILMPMEGIAIRLEFIFSIYYVQGSVWDIEREKCMTLHDGQYNL